MRRRHTIFLASTFIGAALLAACASTNTTPQERGLAAYDGDARLGERTDRICFNRQIDSFYNNKRDTIVVSTGGNNDYLLETRGNCLNLRNAQSVALDSATSCLTPGDAIIVSDNAFSLSDSSGTGPERCMIGSIHKWDKRAAKG